MIGSIDVSIGVEKKSLSYLTQHHFEARLLHTIAVELGYPINTLKVSVTGNVQRTVLVNNRADGHEALAIGRVLDQTVTCLAEAADGNGDDDSDLREQTWKKMSRLLLSKGFERVLGQKFWIKPGRTQSVWASLENHDCTLKLETRSVDTKQVQHEAAIFLLDCDDAALDKFIELATHKAQ